MSNSKNNPTMTSNSAMTTTTSFPMSAEQLYSFAAESVSGYAHRHFAGSLTPEDIQDITINAATKMWQYSYSYDPSEGNLSQWLWTITKNEVLTAAAAKLKRAKISCSLPDGEYPDYYVSSTHSDAEVEVEYTYNEIKDRLNPVADKNGRIAKRAIQKSEREKLILDFMREGYEIEEIAKALSTTLNAVYVQKSEIRKKLQK